MQFEVHLGRGNNTGNNRYEEGGQKIRSPNMKPLTRLGPANDKNKVITAFYRFLLLLHRLGC